MFRALSLSVALILLSCQPKSGDDHHSVKSPTPGNVVQQEMRLLSAAMEATARGVGVGDVKEVEHLLHKVHQAKEETGAALKSGAYKPPKGSDKLARFMELDEQFHHELELLVEASRANDINKTIEALDGSLRACQPCHAEFR